MNIPAPQLAPQPAPASQPGPVPAVPPPLPPGHTPAPTDPNAGLTVQQLQQPAPTMQGHPATQPTPTLPAAAQQQLGPLPDAQQPLSSGVMPSAQQPAPGLGQPAGHAPEQMVPISQVQQIVEQMMVSSSPTPQSQNTGVEPGSESSGSSSQGMAGEDAAAMVDLMFTDPSKFFQTMEQRIDGMIDRRSQATANRQRLWDKFYQMNPQFERGP